MFAWANRYFLMTGALQELLKESDFISLHANLSEDSHMMIGYNELSLMKPDAYLINTARGGLVDENDLYRALEEGIIAGAFSTSLTLRFVAGGPPG